MLKHFASALELPSTSGRGVVECFRYHRITVIAAYVVLVVAVDLGATIFGHIKLYLRTFIWTIVIIVRVGVPTLAAIIE